MAQSALTVTPPNPTPPTNMSCTGATPPNPPNYTKLTYEDYRPDTDFDTSPPPYFDDGAAGSLILFAANTSALASGTGATAGGTEGSYPGAAAGAVPASTSVAHEGAGTELSVTSTYSSGVYIPGGATVMVSTGPVLTAASIALGPNGSHASTLSPAYATNPTLASVGVGVERVGDGHDAADLYRHQLRSRLPDLGQQCRETHDLGQRHQPDVDDRQEARGRDVAGGRQTRRCRRALNPNPDMDLT